MNRDVSNAFSLLFSHQHLLRQKNYQRKKQKTKNFPTKKKKKKMDNNFNFNFNPSSNTTNNNTNNNTGGLFQTNTNNTTNTNTNTNNDTSGLFFQTNTTTTNNNTTNNNDLFANSTTNNAPQEPIQINENNWNELISQWENDLHGMKKNFEQKYSILLEWNKKIESNEGTLIQIQNKSNQIKEGQNQILSELKTVLEQQTSLEKELIYLEESVLKEYKNKQSLTQHDKVFFFFF